MCKTLGLLLCSTLLASCGSSGPPATADDGRGHGASYACGTQQNPTVLVLKDVAPAAGTTVANSNIRQQFTVVDSPAMFQHLSFAHLPAHTAGAWSPATVTLSVLQDGNNLIYGAPVDAWATAPGHVEIAVDGMFATDSGCVLKFPTPLFSYDITPVGSAPADAGAGN